MESLYGHCGLTRQGFHQAAARHRAEAAMMAAIEGRVSDYRRDKDRRAGSRSLYHNLGVKADYGIGVTKFERLMSSHGLSLRPLRVRVVTTRSCEQSWNHPNLAKGLVINGVDQLVVGDLTYLSVGGQRYYLFLLTDVYSGRIVGHHLSRRMRAVDAKAALDAWVSLRGRAALKGCIHHTDGGGQYFSKLYLGLLGGLGVKISVARNCLDNGYAEQRNGLFKNHLLPTAAPGGPQGLAKAVAASIRFHNQERRQEALGWMSPAGFEAHVAGLGDKPPMKLYGPPRQDG